MTKKSSIVKQILICDDIADNCFLFQTYLEIKGYDVDIVTSGIAALDKIKSKKFDLLLLDVMMPGMNGYEVARRIREDPTLKSIAIILVTACEETLVRRECQVTVDGVLRKPCVPDALLSQVEIALESKFQL
jgi:CheY-like chemotaxis protein